MATDSDCEKSELDERTCVVNGRNLKDQDQDQDEYGAAAPVKK